MRALFPKGTKFYQSAQNITKVHQKAPNYTNLNQSAPECTNLQQSAPECNTVYQIAPEYTKVHQSAPEYTKHVPNCTKVCLFNPIWHGEGHFYPLVLVWSDFVSWIGLFWHPAQLIKSYKSCPLEALKMSIFSGFPMSCQTWLRSKYVREGKL